MNSLSAGNLIFTKEDYGVLQSAFPSEKTEKKTVIDQKVIAIVKKLMDTLTNDPNYKIRSEYIPEKKHLSPSKETIDFSKLVDRIQKRAQEEVEATWTSKFFSAVSNLFSTRVSNAHMLLRALNAKSQNALLANLTKKAAKLESIKTSPSLLRRIDIIIAEGAMLSKDANLADLKTARSAIPLIAVGDLSVQLKWSLLRKTVSAIYNRGISSPHRALRALSENHAKQLVEIAKSDKGLLQTIEQDVKQPAVLKTIFDYRLEIRKEGKKPEESFLKELMLPLAQTWQKEAKRLKAAFGIFSTPIQIINSMRVDRYSKLRSLDDVGFDALLERFTAEKETLETAPLEETDFNDMKESILTALKAILADLKNNKRLDKFEVEEFKGKFQGMIDSIEAVNYSAYPPLGKFMGRTWNFTNPGEKSNQRLNRIKKYLRELNAKNGYLLESDFKRVLEPLLDLKRTRKVAVPGIDHDKYNDLCDALIQLLTTNAIQFDWSFLLKESVFADSKLKDGTKKAAALKEKYLLELEGAKLKQKDTSDLPPNGAFSDSCSTTPSSTPPKKRSKD